MKNFIISLFAFMLTIYVSGAVYNIGNHEIHYDNGIYFKIYQSDTFRIDTTTFMIKYVTGTDGSAINTIENTHSLIREYEFITGYISYNYTSGLDFITMCTNLSNESNIEVLELNTEIKYACDQLEPDDDDFDEQQWYLDKIEATRAWNITTGSENVRILIIDSGFDWEHDDLGAGSDTYESTYLNMAEDDWTDTYKNDPCTGNTNDDDYIPGGSSFIDDYKGKGWNGYNPSCPGNGQTFMYNDSRPFSIQWLNDHNIWGDDALRKHRHGTYIAGIIGAKTNNGNYIAGITGGWSDKGVSLIYYKLGTSYHGDGYAKDVNRAIEYGINQNADIIQMAFTGCGQYNPLDEIIEIAYNSGIILVAAAANNNGGPVAYPANNTYVCAVGATGLDDKVLPIANQGPELDLSAPGEDIFGIVPNNGTVLIDGNTSAASAMVSATVGLMLSVNPDLTNNEITTILHESAEEVHPEEYTYINGRCDEIGYGRLNTYQAVCKAWETIEVDEEIDISTTWNDPKSFINPIIVSNGAKLTITSEIQFGPEAVLIIEPGAELELDGGVLTNLKCCGYDDVLWPGVEVRGNKIYSQFECNGQREQGIITILNGGTIENAEIGVLLAARNGDSYNQTGGIIQVPDNGDRNNPSAYFTNNRKSVVFWTYRNFYPDFNEFPLSCTTKLNNAPNVSYLKNCHFEVNGDYIAGGWWYSHIYMLSVNGVNIEGCNFINNKSDSGHGINAYGAGFKVEAICRSQQSPCPEQYLDKNYFYNFYKAINLINGGTYTITVSDAEFFDNTYGVKLKSVNNATVLFSDFHIGENPDGSGECEGEGKESASYGIHMEQCAGFAIEENEFYKAQGVPLGNYVGILCKDSYTQYDIIYKNKLIELSYGNFAEGVNRLDPNEDRDGLEFQCNINTGNSVDFIVTGGQYPQIRTFQGTLSVEAGNTFSSGVQLPDGHFKNTGTQVIDYFYHTDPPVYYTLNYVVPIYVSGENTCPSHYGGGGGGGEGRGLVLSPEEKLQTELDFANNLSDFNNVKVLYDNLKDGGNTEVLQTEVETSWPQDMWELRAELLGKSPHLSKEVLMAAADKTEVLPESILFEILSANPDELRNEELIDYLENKEQPLPEYMISILRQLTGGITYKTILLQDMAKYNAAKSMAAYDLIRSCLNDSETNHEYLRDWLDNLDNLSADMQIVSSFIIEGDYTSAQTILDMIPSLFELEGEALNEYNGYKYLTEMQMQWQQEGRTIFQLDENEVTTLVDYAENTSGKAAVTAQGILEFAYGYNYCDCLPVSDSSVWKSVPAIPMSIEKDNGLFIEATPNPANTWVAFDYKLPIYAGEAVLQISDIKSNIVTAFILTDKYGQQVWDIRDIEGGVYLYTLKTGTVSKSGKLIIE